MTSNATTAFLECVLPDKGWFCGVLFDVPNPQPGVDFPRQQAFASVEELADWLVYNDGIGKTVYHACAAFADPGGVADARTGKRKFRSAANARAARAFWLDIDAGPDRPFADGTEALGALGAFCQQVSIPVPLVVCSGTGLHAYWPLASELDPATWHRYASGLKGLCVDAGFKVDPHRTTDITSILRPVGTHHRKDGVRDVTCGDLPPDYDLYLFEHLLVYSEPEAPAPRVRDDSIIASILTATSYQAVYSDTVADGCAQVATLRASGNLQEPHWYAVAGVLSRCADGAEKFHEWSARDYPGYHAVSAQNKFDRTLTLTGATTCAKLNDVNPGLCASCPHFGKLLSPISLGMTSPSPTIADPVVTPDPASPQPMLPGLPEPFRWSTRGQLCVLSESNKGVQETLVVTENPIYLESVQTAELDRTTFSYRFQHFLPRDGWADVVIDASVLHGASGIATMFGKGVVIHDAKLFLTYVRNAVDDYHDDEALETRYDQFGWKNDNTAFLYGKMLYTGAGPVEAIGAKEVTTRCQWLGTRKGGNVHAWTEAADSLFASQMEAASATVLASFAAPLMRFQSADEGGAILHLFTPESGKGKTTALTGAWTVWGQREGLSLTNEDTKVAKPIAIGTLGNLPVIYDELRDKDPEVIKKFVIMFTEGRDRLRGTTDGALRHTKATWQTVLLSAANSSLVEQLQDDGTDAPSFRVMELSLQLDENTDKAKGDRLRQMLTNNCGYAGDMYLRYLLYPEVREWTQAALQQYTQEIWGRTGLSAEHRFRVRLVGAMAVAGALVNKLDILHFQTTRIVDYLINELMDTKNKGSISQVPTTTRAIAAFGEFINEHVGEMLVVQDKFKPKGPRSVPILKPQHRLSIRYEIAPQRVFIAESAFRAWCQKRSLSPRSMRGVLSDQRLIVDWRRPITLSAGTDLPGVQTPCIEVDASHPAMSGVAQMVQETVQSSGVV